MRDVRFIEGARERASIGLGATIREALRITRFGGLESFRLAALAVLWLPMRLAPLCGLIGTVSLIGKWWWYRSIHHPVDAVWSLVAIPVLWLVCGCVIRLHAWAYWLNRTPVQNPWV